MQHLAGAGLLLGLGESWVQEADLALFHPDTQPVFDDPAYLLARPDADFWRLAEFYAPQATPCACSLASAAMAVGALASHTDTAQVRLTQEALLAAVGDPQWAAQVAEAGSGVTFEELQLYLRRSLDWMRLENAAVEALASKGIDDDALATVRTALSTNEGEPDSVMLAYYNQRVLTGDWGGLHVSPIGAYDADADRVLIMDVDRDLHLPYWTSTEALAEALVTPDEAETGPLAGETGGLIRLAV
ncbi:phytochelatin synthase family protein [Faunimonas sp. B44]|uniref:phytochelatin synthase family protein n=1 Tax=Faunimonas sp. B44 TaxID=3461493 RepID=UPI004044B983